MSRVSSHSLIQEYKEELNENKLVWTLFFCTWFVVMNTTMFNVALPSILIDLHIHTSTAAWIVSGYSIAFAISTLTFSRLSDYIPISRLLFIGLIIFSAASVFGFFTNGFYLLLTARVLQALGAGAVPGLSLIVASRFIPITRRGKGMAIIASGAGLGFGLGPVIGGAATQFFGWNFLFLIPALIIIAIPLLFKLLPNETVKPGHFDFSGSLLTAASVTCFLLYISTLSFLLLSLSVLLFFILWVYLNRKRNPFIQPQLLKKKQYQKLLLIGLIAYLFNFSNLFLMPIILLSQFKKEPIEMGLIIFPGAIIAVLAGQLIGRLIDRYGTRPFVFLGQVFLMIATIMYAYLSSIAPVFILITYLFASVGFASINSGISNEVTRILPRGENGAGMGLLQLLQFTGGAVGVTICGLLLKFQEGMALQLIYRNIYLCLFVFICIAFITKVFYVKSAKQKTRGSL
ncbi:MFS transporter [Cytobacillus purgationiresistens]|uniref:DHA2 family metal-tetracycline-proton antiporter-like MFS transporter n=1 Tax=Cytobacillus purgationiresistens TaxID=863449 RepID=A0ABU0AEX0_9BACI|nr:MFS transporter [Cytobacillus purgationiresistens]MDQ0269807.1 DHA2 family metal-tetracycline-proton antiporter-like MFS transporter [Cytobacillus purgationiresistens]